VPLEAFVSKFVNMRFEPSGMTKDPDIRFASSLVDYVFRRLALEYLPADKRADLGVQSIDERKEYAQSVVNGGVDAGASEAVEGPADDAQVQLIPLAEIPAKASPGARVLDAPLCYSCGAKMQPAGSCYVCTGCGSTSGCS
jgi:ribonucleoside-diphosphate reductase alpha chain